MLRLLVFSLSGLILSLAFFMNGPKKPLKNEIHFKEANCTEHTTKCEQTIQAKTKSSEIFLREQKRKKKVAYA